MPNMKSLHLNLGSSSKNTLGYGPNKYYIVAKVKVFQK